MIHHEINYEILEIKSKRRRKEVPSRARVRVVSVLESAAKVTSPVSLSIEVIGEQTGNTSIRTESSRGVVRHVDVIDGVTVAVRRRVASGTEPIDEVQEAFVAVLTGAVGATAGHGVVSVVLEGAKVGDLLALVVLAEGFAAAVDDCLAVLLVVGGVVGESFGPVVVVGAVGDFDGSVGAQPDHGVRVCGPEGDGDAAGLDGGQGGVALDHLGDC